MNTSSDSANATHTINEIGTEGSSCKHKDYELLSSTLDGTWSKKWREAQTLPKHLIDNKTSAPEGGFYCTCGEWCGSIAQWSKHTTEKIK